jgi:hypothetical protein
MEHTPRPPQNTICPMGVFMTASEANHERVLSLIREEDRLLLAHAITEDIKGPAAKRGKPLSIIVEPSRPGNFPLTFASPTSGA